MSDGVNLHPEIAASDHDTADFLENFLEMLDGLRFFDFRDDWFGRTRRGNEFLQRPNIRRTAHETQRDPVNVMRQPELDVSFVLLCEGGEGQR